ncbi:branched-chain amino acid aminotransferase [Candidatus Saccharibacteria bacterium RIFCSPLOWO2_02_FULL_46_7]|nr:MAG: branched-chain amino acid aminotransferase [Candidatus Saccharibacteria bacterium RIFCSPLOWO2_02_FULL_46_7]
MAKIYPKAYFGNRLVDQKAASLNITTSAILYGLSVYTVFPVMMQEGKKMAAFRLEDHFNRLSESARIIGIDGFNGSWNYLKFVQAIKKLNHENKIKEDVFIRATLHVDEELPGTRSRGLHTVFSMFAYEAQPILSQNGARLKTSVWRRVPDYSIPSRAKVNGAYINSVLAKQDALDSGYDDCIFLDSVGHVCELSAANIFLVRSGKLITPDTASDILEGINRKTIIQLAKEAGIEVIERTVDLTELYIADEVFASGTSAFIAPVVEVDARRVANGKTGSMTSKLKKLHEEALRGAGKKHHDWLTYL